MAFSPDGKILASGSVDKTVRLWDVQTYTSIRTLSGHSSMVNVIAFSPDGKTLVSGSSMGETIRIWDVQNGASLKTITGHKDVIYTIAFSRMERH